MHQSPLLDAHSRSALFAAQTRYLHMASMTKGAMVLFGGEHITKYALDSYGPKDHKLNDLWAYAIKANRWVQLAQSDCKVRPAIEGLGLRGVYSYSHGIPNPLRGFSQT